MSLNICISFSLSNLTNEQQNMKAAYTNFPSQIVNSLFFFLFFSNRLKPQPPLLSPQDPTVLVFLQFPPLATRLNPGVADSKF